MQKRPRGKKRIKKQKTKNAKVKIRTTPIVMVMIKSKGALFRLLFTLIKKQPSPVINPAIHS
jgi:hypothetical protein